MNSAEQIYSEDAEKWLHKVLSHHQPEDMSLEVRMECLEALWALEIALGREQHWSSLDR